MNPYGIEGPFRAKRKPLKRYVAIAALVAAGIVTVLLTGCSNLPPNTTIDAQQQLVLDKQIPSMSRNEVITAVTECTSQGLRAVMIYGKRKINQYTADIVVDVTCAPKY
jgi:ABC-type uncharacterized transport system auxiliary subunit